MSVQTSRTHIHTCISGTKRLLPSFPPTPPHTHTYKHVLCLVFLGTRSTPAARKVASVARSISGRWGGHRRPRPRRRSLRNTAHTYSSLVVFSVARKFPENTLARTVAPQKCGYDVMQNCYFSWCNLVTMFRYHAGARGIPLHVYVLICTCTCTMYVRVRTYMHTHTTRTMDIN